MATSENPRWHPPLIPGIPEGLFPSGHAIEAAYMNSGRMSEGLARLQSSTILLKNASIKNGASADYTRRHVSGLLMTMHKDVLGMLSAMQERLDDEMDGIRAKVRKDQASTLAAVDRHVQGSVSAVENALQDAGGEVRNEFNAALEYLKECGSGLQQDINTTERGYMRTLAQLIISNTWSSAWPEAVRTLQAEENANAVQAPPQYGVDVGGRVGGAPAGPQPVNHIQDPSQSNADASITASVTDGHVPDVAM
ncbi:hypothetical protein CF319_g5811 [Tilletia indica]|nr:hypothetical protein CF319_g5811 [Tilletia indica]